LKPSERKTAINMSDDLTNCSHDECLSPMSSEVENSNTPLSSHSDDEIKKLEEDYQKLLDDSQNLINERSYLETEIRTLKKRATRLDDEVRLLKTPPLIIGHLQDVLDERTAIVRSSNGTVFQVSLNQRLEPERLKPGTRVALNQDTLAVIEVLHEAWDPLVSGAEVVDKPDITYDSVAGLDEQIQLIREAIELPLLEPELFSKIGITPPKGILLVGPPGCGKTLLAKAVANHTDATFIRMVGSELAQKYIGEGGRMVRELFSLAKEKSPSIIFLDEIDAIGAKRLDGSTSGDREVQRTLMQLLAELDGFDALEDVKIIAATNRPDILDDALLRPGRFDRIVTIPLPDAAGRKDILALHTSKMSTSRINLKAIVDKTEGYSGAELKATCVEAGMVAIREKRNKITQSDFLLAVERIQIKKLTSGSTSSPDALYG
jgi:proteasome regulatory subunit